MSTLMRAAAALSIAAVMLVSGTGVGVADPYSPRTDRSSEESFVRYIRSQGFAEGTDASILTMGYFTCAGRRKGMTSSQLESAVARAYALSRVDAAITITAGRTFLCSSV